MTSLDILAGPVAAALGTRAVLGGVALITVLITVATLAVPATWRIRSAPSEQVEPAAAGVPVPAEPVEGVPDSQTENRTATAARLYAR